VVRVTTRRFQLGVAVTTFRQLLDVFEGAAKTRAAKGRRFEDFCEAFFLTDPFWAERFDAIWSWMDWPGREGRGDTGIDLVARENGTGDLVAIQCKFYSPDATLAWGHVSTFVAMLSRDEFTSGMIVSTAGSESANLHANLDLHQKPVLLWRVQDFEDSRVDWDRFTIDRPAQLNLRPPKLLHDYQRAAIDDVVAGMASFDRGQLVMACGTGKTFTSLRLAERVVGSGGSILFLVPSINLVSQTVKAWANDAGVPLVSFAVCSDIRAGQRRENEDMSANDLSFPASTNATALLDEISARRRPDAMTVVFSTYQSIDVISACQEGGLGAFDLIICDEAHRTTGAFRDVDDQSAFTKVHDNTLVASRKRVYMTATPKVYGDQAKRQAAEADVVIASMDDETRFGPVFHELRFGAAVAKGLLTDYRVLVIAVDQDAVSEAFQRQLATDGELALDDYARIVGCWHGLSKRGPQFGDDNQPMGRAVAFSSTIRQSKRFAAAFPAVVNQALQDRSDTNAVMVEAQHVDGTINVKVRSEAIAWLEEPPGQRVCRVLSNAKCLTEGVDVPALDSVIFLNPRKSIVDVVQAVGRVMRLSKGKDLGYVILPIGVPAGVAPEEALRDNKRYQVVWQVLQALRSHDERLAAEINKIDINKASSKVSVIGIGMGGGDDPDNPGRTTTQKPNVEGELIIPDLSEWRDALYARIVEKVGDRRYMENWARDVSAIAAAQDTRIRTLLDHPDTNPAAVVRFEEFHTALKHNLNDSISRDDAIGMLSQHLITRPVFEALFGDADFTQRNPVSKVMQDVLDVLDEHNIAAETAILEGFYSHIRVLIGDIDTAEGKQRVITGLYEKFFKRALPKEAEALGIVYTPVEVVDFINRAVNDLLAEHFGASLSDEGVHILDPFTGTGTFITRLMHTGLIEPDTLRRKYASELHANEIMLLAYYIAAINIENTYHSIVQPEDYEPFTGIVLTDTFQMSEGDDTMDTVLFPVNNDRVDRQKQLDIRVILGNPPYSVGQTSQNDNNANLAYSDLDRSIASTYAARSPSTNKNSLYDSYIRAIRWASNRVLASLAGGIVGFVTNGGWIDSTTGMGLRSSLSEEFDYVYVYNLRGNQKGDWRREGGKVFDQGSQVTVAIVLLVRCPEASTNGPATIQYFEVDDYLSREQKLASLLEPMSTVAWRTLEPNEHADWIALRDPRFGYLTPLAGDKGGIFGVVSNGLQTNRDAWAYSSSRAVLRAHVERLNRVFNEELDGFASAYPPGIATLREREALAKKFVDLSPASFRWDRDQFKAIARGERLSLDSTMIRSALYRPFFAQQVVFDRSINVEVSRVPELFPDPDSDNLVIVVQKSGPAPFPVFASDRIPDLVVCGAGNLMGVYPRWRYVKPTDGGLFDGGPQKVSNINPDTVNRFRERYGFDVDEDAVFAYVYGILHSPDFRSTFAVNLQKEAPRVPLVATRELFDAFVAAGRDLLDLHISYEAVEPYPLTEEWAGGADPDHDPTVLLVGSRKLAHPKVTDPATGKRVDDLTRLVYNDHLTLTGIPVDAYRYELGTRSAIGWLIDRYYITTDGSSGIVNDPNQWGLERGEPRYIIDLIKRVVTVSVKSVAIIAAIPALDFDESGVASGGVGTMHRVQPPPTHG
jgi:predicted helicase